MAQGDPLAAEADANDDYDEQRRRSSRHHEEEMERWLLEQEQAEIEETTTADGWPAPVDQDVVAAAVPPPPPPQQQQQQLILQPQLQQQKTSSVSGISYRTASFMALAALLWYALRTRKQYYLAVVYLTSSKWAYVVIGNAILAFAVTVFDVSVKTFLSGLRLHEAEGLQDFFRWNVTETCLALTMFRHELTIETALLFVALITVKCLHHVAAQREQHLRMTEDAVQGEFPYVRPSQVRLVVFLMVLQSIDMYAVQQAVEVLLLKGPSVKILFAFEAAILLVSAWSHVLLWHLHVIDSAIQYGHEREWPVASRLLHPWKEYKSTLTFAVELQARAIDFLFYSTFFALILTYYGMPINLFREVYVSFVKLRERLTAFFNYRQLMASMNRFRNATDAELEEAGRTCIICRDEMCVADCKRLPVCAHTFHKSCLREWLVQQQSCPTCRADIAAMEAQEAARNAGAAAATQRTEQQPEIQSEETAETPDENLVRPLEEHMGNDPQRSTQAVTGAVFTNTSDDNTSQSNNLETTSTEDNTKNVHFANKVNVKTYALDFRPAMYEVVHEVAVLSVEDVNTGTRTIPTGMLVLCLSLQRHAFDNGEAYYLLRIPDGWIREDSVRKFYELA